METTKNTGTEKTHAGPAVVSREIHLVSHPIGLPVAANFSIVQAHLRPLRDGEVVVRNLYMSVDPYMRGRMNEGKSYVPAFELGQAMEGGAIGEVVESRAQELQPGDMVVSNFGWRERFVAMPKDLHQVDPAMRPLSVYLGALGMTGMTAWAGLHLAEIKPGDVVFVSGAAGAVGNMVGQLAKIYACRVVGSTGSNEKVRTLTDKLGFDSAFNYKSAPILGQLNRSEPTGIDVYFDNVGGEALEAALSALRIHGRIIACGGIAAYNEAAPRPGPANLFCMTTKRLSMKGLIVRDWLARQKEFETEVGGYVKSGKVCNIETVVVGIEHAVDAFIGLFKGENIGKMVVKLM